jgi:hypothetical protein
MYPIRYTALPFSRKLMMSLCHSWFGVLRSKNRGLPGFSCGLRLGDSIIPASVSSACTVLGDAFKRNIRRNRSLMRLTPRLGSSRLSSRILAPVPPRRRGRFRRLLSGSSRSRRPASP